ncbi:MAG: hypothetical protein HRT34_08975, partial [Alcanivorax sp.]|nr:hypothetical protein [Alcanivorax sp.]
MTDLSRALPTAGELLLCPAASTAGALMHIFFVEMSWGGFGARVPSDPQLVVALLL